jgi:hypothetical protein
MSASSACEAVVECLIDEEGDEARETDALGGSQLAECGEQLRR